MPPITVDIFRSPLAATDAHWAVLNDRERARAERIRIPRAAEQFVAARGMLREMLGKRMGIAPRDVELTFGPHGKPYLADRAHPLRFNLAHSHGQVVFAFAEGVELGVDVEMQRPQVRCEDLAKRYFSRDEAAKLTALPPAERCAAFFRCWTRKEAFIKAKGEGLHLPLDQFDVAFRPDEQPALLRTRWDETEAPRWRMYDVDAEPGYASALAIEADAVIRYI